jgi:hypothetical protein
MLKAQKVNNATCISLDASLKRVIVNTIVNHKVIHKCLIMLKKGKSNQCKLEVTLLEEIGAKNKQHSPIYYVGFI